MIHNHIKTVQFEILSSHSIYRPFLPAIYFPCILGEIGGSVPAGRGRQGQGRPPSPPTQAPRFLTALSTLRALGLRVGTTLLLGTGELLINTLFRSS